MALFQNLISNLRNILISIRLFFFTNIRLQAWRATQQDIKIVAKEYAKMPEGTIPQKQQKSEFLEQLYRHSIRRGFLEGVQFAVEQGRKPDWGIGGITEIGTVRGKPLFYLLTKLSNPEIKGSIKEKLNNTFNWLVQNRRMYKEDQTYVKVESGAINSFGHVSNKTKTQYRLLTPLTYAIHKELLKEAYLLLQHGANPYSNTHAPSWTDSFSPLLCAIELNEPKERRQMVLAILKARDKWDQNHDTPYEIAGEKSDLQVALEKSIEMGDRDLQEILEKALQKQKNKTALILYRGPQSTADATDTPEDDKPKPSNRNEESTKLKARL